MKGAEETIELERRRSEDKKKTRGGRRDGSGIEKREGW